MAVKAKRAETSTRKVEVVPQEPQKKSHKKLRIVLLALIGPLAAILAGLYIYFIGGRFVSTDNAYVKSEKIAISADISGRIAEVAVHENQQVNAGTLLFRIDAEPFRIALDQAKARLMSARQEIEAQRALHKQKLAELNLAEGDVAFYKRQHERQQTLNKRGFASGTNLDTANRNLRNAQDRIATIMQDIAQAQAKLGGDADIPSDNQPAVLDAKAQHDKAALDLRHTNVSSPAAGIVTNFDMQPGEYLEAGDVVFSIIGSGKIWVHANYKETKLTDVRVGQKATINIDAYPNDVREAVVASISPATGAEFALLPPQNATGNWVKVVQRLPVRLELKEPLRDPPLRAGMSVVVEIDTEHQRDVPDFAQSVVNWIRSLL